MLEIYSIDAVENAILQASGDTTVLIEYMSYICAYCLDLKRTYEKLENELGSEKLKVYFINAIKHPNISDHYRVINVPHSKCFKNGRLIADFVGYLKEEEIRPLFEI